MRSSVEQAAFRLPVLPLCNSPLNALADRRTAWRQRAKITLLRQLFMMPRRAEFQEDIQFQVLRRLHDRPDLSQRKLAQELGISLGSINYGLQALVARGWVKAQNFSQSQNKIGYVYLLTPTGIAQKTKLTAMFLKRKMSEYDELREEIAQLKAELPGDLNKL